MSNSTLDPSNIAQKGEDQMGKLARVAIAALCQSVKDTDEVENFSTLQPLVLATLIECPSDAHNLLYDLFNCEYHIAGILLSRFIPYLTEITTAIGPSMLTLPIHHSHFSLFLSTADRMCKLFAGNCSSLLGILVDTCIRALRSPHTDAGTEEGQRVESAKDESLRILLFWMQSKVIFAPHAQEVSKLMIELLETEKDTDKTNKIVWNISDLLCCMDAVGGSAAMRRMWIEYWNILKRLIKEEKHTTLCIKTLICCINVMDDEVLSVDEVKEIGVMMKEQLERELRRRETENNAIINEQMEKPGGLLNEIICIINPLYDTVGAQICQIMHPLMPIIFKLIEKCSDKHWGVRVPTHLILRVPDFALQYYDQIVALLDRSLTDSRPMVRQWAARAYRVMAVSNNPVWIGVAVSMVDPLCRLIYRDDARRGGEYTLATEAAIASIVDIVKNCGELVGDGKINEILASFLDWLPITGTRATIIYGFLVDLIEDYNMAILGEPNAKRPKLISVLTKAINEDIFDRDGESQSVKRRVIIIIKAMAEDNSFFECARRADLNLDEVSTLARILHSSIP